MGQFPALATPWGTLLLPLAERTAHQLTSALLSDGQIRQQCLAQAISQDPHLALWALCCAQQRGVSATSLADLVNCLAGTLAGEMVWNNSPPSLVSSPEFIQDIARQASAQLSGAEEQAFVRSAAGALAPSLDGCELTQGAVERLQSLSARLTRLEQLEHDIAQTLNSEKLESLRQLAYGAGHEINNPLANISARAQTLLNEETDPERRRKLAAINAQAFRAHEMIADMMLFARPPAPKLRLEDLAPLVRSVASELQSWAAQQQTDLRCQLPDEPLWAEIDKTQICVALRALVVNALESLSSGGQVQVLLDGKPGAAGRAMAQISVEDNGPGLSEQARRHLFDPFYSGREAGRGLGLGLSKCWRIVSMHGGRLDVESPRAYGAKFTIRLDLPRS